MQQHMWARIDSPSVCETSWPTDSEAKKPPSTLLSQSRLLLLHPRPSPLLPRRQTTRQAGRLVPPFALLSQSRHLWRSLRAALSLPRPGDRAIRPACVASCRQSELGNPHRASSPRGGTRTRRVQPHATQRPLHNALADPRGQQVAEAARKRGVKGAVSRKHDSARARPAEDSGNAARRCGHMQSPRRPLGRSPHDREGSWSPVGPGVGPNAGPGLAPSAPAPRRLLLPTWRGRAAGCECAVAVRAPALWRARSAWLRRSPHRRPAAPSFKGSVCLLLRLLTLLRHAPTEWPAGAPDNTRMPTLRSGSCCTSRRKSARPKITK